jgi:hypothetical protein
MNYYLNVSGVISPLGFQTPILRPAVRGAPYNHFLSTDNGTGPFTWSLLDGALPPGMSVESTGAIDGTPTADGPYSFGLQVKDSSNPPQTAVGHSSLLVVEPLQVSSAAIWPNACVNQPYSFTMQASGGLPPYDWTFFSSNWTTVNLNQQTGVFSGTPLVAGTFTGTVGVNDPTSQSASQLVTLTAQNCP